MYTISLRKSFLMSLSNSLLTLLNSRALDPNPSSHSWPFICRELLKSEPVHEQYTDIQQHLSDAINAVIPVNSKESVFARGALERPYWRAVEECLTRTIFPWRKEGDNLKILIKSDVNRIPEIEQELARISPMLISNKSQEAEQLQLLSDFFFTFLSPQDIRPFLSLRTTVGSQLDLFPPSLHECISTFTKTYVKVGGKPSSTRAKPTILTVGAKALSKHWHRDRTVGFWRVCTGSEKQKNEAANLVLADILVSTAWANLHWLNPNVVTYEIRNTDGYGVRWEAPTPTPPKPSSSSASEIPKSSSESSTDNLKLENVKNENLPEDSLEERQLQQDGWTFRGFLEPFMEGGHERGWVH